MKATFERIYFMWFIYFWFVVIVCGIVSSFVPDFFGETSNYDTHLTQKQLVSVVDEDMTVVFYKRSCPYCRAGKQAVIRAGKSSDLPVFYVDVETKDGQKLVSRYGIQRPFTVLKIRSGSVKLYLYAKKVNGKIVADEAAIKEAFSK